MSDFLIDYPFAERLYPNAVDAVRRLGEFGPKVILTDGDVVSQPRKVRRSGLWDAVAGRVLIYIHKECMLNAVQRDDCRRIVATAHCDGRDTVGCIVLGRGADAAQMRHWLATAAGVEGFIGFAVGRTTFWDAVVGWHARTLTRAEAVARIARRLLKWVDTFEGARAA